jgi:very-short-patch-repair endonuclease
MKNPYKENGLFRGTNNLLFARAKELRSNMTDAETILINNFNSPL